MGMVSVLRIRYMYRNCCVTVVTVMEVSKTDLLINSTVRYLTLEICLDFLNKLNVSVQHFQVRHSPSQNVNREVIREISDEYPL